MLIAHSLVPLVRARAEVAQEYDPSRNPIFQAMFDWEERNGELERTPVEGVPHVRNET